MSIEKKKLENYEQATIWVIAISFIIRVIITFITNEGGDPAWHLNIARFIGENFKIPIFEFLGREAFSKPPLFHIIGGVLYSLFGIAGIKIVSALAGTGILIYTYLIAKKLTNEKIAFFSVLFMAFIPLSIYLSVTGHTEMLSAFFFIGAVYYLLKDKPILCGIFTGLALLSKEFTIMLIPLIIYCFIAKDKKSALKNIAITTAIAAIIAAPWYIRNIIIFGNPAWPFFISLFGAKYVYIGGLKPIAHSLLHLLNPNVYQSMYLELFGVPVGNINSFCFLPLPKIFIYIWFAGTVLFFLPIIKGLFSKNDKRLRNILLVIIGLFMLVFIEHVYQNSTFVARYFVYTLPAIAIFWGIGIEKLYSKYGKVVLILVLLISAGFICAEAVKANVGSNLWNFYEDDFKWVQENTPSDSLFMAGGQAMSYKLHREAIYLPENEKMSPSYIPELNKFDYIFVNQEFKPDKRVVLNETLVEEIKNNKEFELVYSNNKTKTEIYKNIIS